MTFHRPSTDLPCPSTTFHRPPLRYASAREWTFDDLPPHFHDLLPTFHRPSMTFHRPSTALRYASAREWRAMLRLALSPADMERYAPAIEASENSGF